MSLVVVKKSPKTNLSPQEEEFNKLIQKIEKLKIQINEKTVEMDHCLKLWGESGLNEFRKIIDLRFKLAQVLNDFLFSKKIKSTSDREICSELIMIQMVLISRFTEIYTPEGFIEFRNKLTDDKDTKMDSEAIEFAANQFEEHLDSLGIETDFDIRQWMKDGADPNEFSEDLRNKMNEKLHENNIPGPDQSKKRKKQSGKKTIIELVHKNLNELYRQLARIFHPDLETDLEKKKIKEQLMTELNLAYAAKNFHSMLQMEIQWLSSSAEKFESLSKEKLQVYIHSLKEQIKILRNDLEQTPYQKRYFVLQEIASPQACYSINSYRNILKEYEVEARELSFTINSLLQTNGMKHLKKLIDDVNDYSEFSF